MQQWQVSSVKSGMGQKEELSDTVDGVNGQQEVADKFREVYDTLYNSSGSQTEMDSLQTKIQNLSQSDNSIEEINKLTPEIVKQSVMMMKHNKPDITQGFS